MSSLRCCREHQNFKYECSIVDWAVGSQGRLLYTFIINSIMPLISKSCQSRNHQFCLLKSERYQLWPVIVLPLTVFENQELLLLRLGKRLLIIIRSMILLCCSVLCVLLLQNSLNALRMKTSVSCSNHVYLFSEL